MNIHEFGKENSKILLMFHGSCMSWDMYKESIEILKSKYHIIIPALPGHDLTNNSEFSSVEEVVKEVEDWLIKNGYSEIWGLYGLSMGGSCVIRFLANNRVKVKKAIIDAGITPYQLPWILTRFILIRDYLMIQIGRHSKKALVKAMPPEKYPKESIDFMYKILKHMTSKTVWNVFGSCNNYSMPKVLPAFDTEVQYWYGAEERKARYLDIKYVHNMFNKIKFVEIPNVDHGEFCTMFPKEFSNKIIAFIK